ncbi:MAG TPA: hypothetical protein VKV35_08100 [Streptosporangiaceae bacterium]|jgi:cyanate permease|nr:hypothetical protein [Streptosporangiaceae bacterium]
MITLESTSAGLVHAAPGRQWSGPIYVATPQLLRAFGIRQSEVSNLLVILVGMPLAATVLGWLLAGRDPAGIPRQPLE